MKWGRPLVMLAVVTAIGGGGFELLLPGGKASESFYGASAAIAAALFVAMTLAAAPIFTAAPSSERERRRYLTAWSAVVAIGFVFNAAAASGSLAALNHCHAAAGRESLCGNGFNTHLVGLALIIGIAVLFAQIASTALDAISRT